MVPPESDDDLHLEIGHVLFIDIIGYSKLLIEDHPRDWPISAFCRSPHKYHAGAAWFIRRCARFEQQLAQTSVNATRAREPAYLILDLILMPRLKEYQRTRERASLMRFFLA